jgi:hypothetical protein
MSHNNLSLAVTIQKDSRGSERRRFARHPCHQTSSCHAINPAENKNWQAIVYDISLSGLSLVTDYPFDEGEILVIQLENPIEGFRPRLFARVIRATEEAAGKWLIGCRLINLLTDYELQVLLDGATR